MPRDTALTTFFFFNDTATTEIYTLSLHDALPISVSQALGRMGRNAAAPLDAAVARELAEREGAKAVVQGQIDPDRKSTRLNSSHSQISYAVFCLKKKKENTAAPWMNTGPR